tara:strand:+ start:333 stop:1298 length:966 start_codon:yes stop_codon:yes gene_type:complete
MYRVVVTDGLAPEAINKLKSKGIEVDEISFTREEIIDGAISEYDAVIIRSATRLDEKAINSNSGGPLKFICRAGVGVDNIDLKAAKRQNILVLNAPSSTTQSVAELTIGHLISCVRRIPEADRLMKQGIWAKKQLRGTELSGKNLGLVGYGRIARKVAQIANSFGMNVHSYDPFLPKELFGSTLVHESIESLFSTCTHISVHCNLTEQTMNLIGERLIELMPNIGADGSKCGTHLVSLSRGGIVNEKEIVKCLKSGKLTSLGLDVFEIEPVIKNELLDCNNFIGTPHIAASTVEAQIRVGLESVSQVIMALDGEKPTNIVN